MSEYKMHIAQRGKKAGQWVRCTAKGTCRVGGNHITSETLKALIAFSNKLEATTPKPGDDNYEEYVKWAENEAKNPTVINLNSKEKPIVLPFKDTDTEIDPHTVYEAIQKHTQQKHTKTDWRAVLKQTLEAQKTKVEEEKQAALRKKFIQPASNADEIDANYAIEHNLDWKTSVLLAISLTHSQWMKFLDRSYKLGVDIPLDVVKKGGANFRAGNTVFETILPLRGKADALKALSEDTGI